MKKKSKQQLPVSERFIGKAIAVGLFITMTFFTLRLNTNTDTIWKQIPLYLTTLGFIYFLLRMVLSFFYRPFTGDVPEGATVSVVIPTFNDPYESIDQTLQSLLKQDYPIREIFMIDDGSQNGEALFEMLQTTYGTSQQMVDKETGETFETHIYYHRFETNQGKRAAQAYAIPKSSADYVLMGDSDGYFHPDVVRNLLRPFQDPKVYAVSGHVNARNASENIVTLMQDLLYESAFRVGRGSQTVTRTVLVCSGAISMYRDSFLKANMEQFVNQIILGKKRHIGDDRRLTNLALRAGGRTVYQSTARCVTDVPTSIRVFFKQQVRWSKSFYLESIDALNYAWKRPFVLMWLAFDGLIWILFGLSMLISAVQSFGTLTWITLAYTITYFILAVLSKGVYYIFKNPFLYLVSPFFAVIQAVLLYPIRIYAILTLDKTAWGTR